MKIVEALIGVLFTFPLVSGQAAQGAIFRDVQVDVNPNPYFDSADVRIGGEFNNTIALRMAMNQMMPADLMIKTNVNIDGIEMSSLELALCGPDRGMMPFDTTAELVGVDISSSECPISMDDPNFDINLKVRDWKFPLPYRVQNGVVTMDITLENEANSFLNLHAVGEVVNRL